MRKKLIFYTLAFIIYAAVFAMYYTFIMSVGIVDGLEEAPKHLIIYVIGLLIPYVAEKITSYFF